MAKRQRNPAPVAMRETHPGNVIAPVSRFNVTEQALLEEKKNGSRYRLVKLDIDGNKPAQDSFVTQG